MPVAYLFLGALILLCYIFKLNISKGSLITSALYIRNFSFNYSDNWFTGHFWTLSIEEQFYIIFPFLLVFSLNNYVKTICFLVLGIPLLQFVGYSNIGVFYNNQVIHKATFLLINLFGSGTTSILIGSLLSILMFKEIIPDKNITNGNRFLSFALLIIAVTFRMFFIDIVPGTYVTSTIFSLFIALIIYLTITQKNDFLSKILKNKILVKLGILSYSLYIWQQIFIYDQPWAHSFKYSDSFLFNIPMIFIVAYISYHFYELKFLKLKEKFKLVGYNIDKKIL